MNHADCGRALSDRRRDSLQGSCAHVARGKDAGGARLLRERGAAASAARRVEVGELNVGAGGEEPMRVSRQPPVDPVSAGLRPDEHEEPARGKKIPLVEGDSLERAVAVKARGPQFLSARGCRHALRPDR